MTLPAAVMAISTTCCRNSWAAFWRSSSISFFALVIIVAGTTTEDVSDDMLIIKYSSAGVAQWTNRYNGPGNSTDSATAVAVDSSGNIIVTGSSSGGESGLDFVTIKYSSAGMALWTNRYNGPGNGYDQATHMALDGNGNGSDFGVLIRSE